MLKRRSKPGTCPWTTYPTHSRNRELQCNGDRPIIFGHCPQAEDCAFCAGTLYKPNLLLQVGRPFTFAECPFCLPDLYRRRVEKLKLKLPRGSGAPPPQPKAPPAPAPPAEGEVDPDAPPAEGEADPHGH